MVFSLLALMATLRHVYAVGTAGNDHFVAAVVTGCMGWYTLMWVHAPVGAWPFFAVAVLTQWGLFFCAERDRACPAWARWGLALPSQVTYGFALWGGLATVVRAPVALVFGLGLFHPGWWLMPPFLLAVSGTFHAVVRHNRLKHHAVPGLPGRVVHLSDLHASPTNHEIQLRAIVDRVNGLDPDLVLVTGDLLTPFSERVHDYLLRQLARIRAPVYACPGNHDLPVIERFVAELRGVGVRMLIDEAVLGRLGGRAVEVAGVQFHWRGGKARLEEAVDKLLEPPEVAFRILLVHNPESARHLRSGRFDLVLSGHTHGGQVGLNMFGLRPTLYGLFGGRDQGWWRAGGVPHHVHCGNWLIGLPPRMGVASEIVVLDPPGHQDGHQDAASRGAPRGLQSE